MISEVFLLLIFLLFVLLPIWIVYELYIYCFVLSQRPKTAHGAYLQQAPNLPRYATCSGGVEWIKKSLGANGRSVFVLGLFFFLFLSFVWMACRVLSMRRSRFIRWFNSYPKSYEIVRVLHNHRKEEDNMTIGYIYNIFTGESCWKQINFSWSIFFICCWRCRYLLYHRSSLNAHRIGWFFLFFTFWCHLVGVDLFIYFYWMAFNVLYCNINMELVFCTFNLNDPIDAGLNI